MKHNLVFTLMFVFLLALGATAASAASVTPVFVAGNPSCEDLGYDFGFKVDPPNPGTYDIDGFNTVTVTTNGVNFDWTSTLGMDAVIAKGGPNANVYVYDPPAESIGDTGLHSPINPRNGNPFGLSHIEFCFDYEVIVSKTAETTFVRTWLWEIDKSVDPSTLDLFDGDSGDAHYVVTVTKLGFEDSDWAVSGTITIVNNTPLAATITDVADVVSPAVAAAVDCGVAFPYVLAAGGTLVCTYSTPLPDGSDQTNTATVTTTGSVGGGSGTFVVVFGDPTTVVNDTVTVSDDQQGDLGSFSDSGTAEYDMTFTCPADEGDHPNTATINETGQSASASVTVNCYAPTVSKDGSGEFHHDVTWDIDKSVVEPEYWLNVGESAMPEYTVTVTKTVDEYGSASGSITVDNPHPTEDITVAVSDPGVTLDASCAALFVPAGGSNSCGWTKELSSADSFDNTATITLYGIDYAGSANIPVTYLPTGDEEVDVSDSLAGILGHIDDSRTFTYPLTFECGSVPGDFDHPNTATITGPTTSDSADADVLLHCYAPSISKDGSGEFHRDVTWDITKSVVETSYSGNVGDSFTPNYTVHVNKYVNEYGSASGTIYVTNPNPEDPMNVTVSDSLPVALTCNGMLTVPPSSTATCGWSIGLSNANPFDNTATVSLDGYSAATTTTIGVAYIPSGFENITVTDNQVGALGGAGDTHTFYYPRTLTCGSAGEFDYPNTATIDQTGQNSSANVHLSCVQPSQWCSPGYWMNHPESWTYGISPDDPYYNYFPAGSLVDGPSPATPNTIDPSLMYVLEHHGEYVNGGEIFNQIGDLLSAAAGLSFTPGAYVDNCPLN